ncbi:unnamed protein product [Brugia timori]|uniref:Uncharacterized protein n=1 Tax=Brugia timori TaxID=42155 RepID=A0A3P7WST1_9BILA|nr:unnamed protein product [Brugia timori]
MLDFSKNPYITLFLTVELIFHFRINYGNVAILFSFLKNFLSINVLAIIEFCLFYGYKFKRNIFICNSELCI